MKRFKNINCNELSNINGGRISRRTACVLAQSTAVISGVLTGGNPFVMVGLLGEATVSYC